LQEKAGEVGFGVGRSRAVAERSGGAQGKAIVRGVKLPRLLQKARERANTAYFKAFPSANSPLISPYFPTKAH